jgi:pimeloyl-ACP methyl ester carboxylesterase
MRTPFLIILLLLAFTATPVFPADRDNGTLIEIPTRPDVTVPVYFMKRSNAVATIALIPGGHGSFTVKKEGLESDDFLVKNRDQFARQGFNVAVVGRPRDIRDLSLARRRTADHLEDIRKVVQYLRDETALPVWLVGTSRGTVSVASAAIAYGNEELAGIVLTSSVTSTLELYSVPKLRLEKIQVPVLVLHHEKDSCSITDPAGAREIIGRLANAPVARAIMVSGGWLPSGNPCSSSHWHGYSGMEREAVDIIAKWVREPSWW